MLKSYMGFSRGAGSEEGAVLIFAHDIKEAKKFAYKFICEFFEYGADWIDTGVRLLRNDALMAEADSEKLCADEAHMISNPKTCGRCELWGGTVNDDGSCEFCEDVE